MGYAPRIGESSVSIKLPACIHWELISLRRPMSGPGSPMSHCKTYIAEPHTVDACKIEQGRPDTRGTPLLHNIVPMERILSFLNSLLRLQLSSLGALRALSERSKTMSRVLSTIVWYCTSGASLWSSLHSSACRSSFCSCLPRLLVPDA